MPAEPTFDLPHLLTADETCQFARWSRSELNRRMKRHEFEWVKLSEGRSGRVRIVRDSLLTHLGLIDSSKPPRRRRDRRAQAEQHRAAARFGIDIEETKGPPRSVAPP